LEDMTKELQEKVNENFCKGIRSQTESWHPLLHSGRYGNRRNNGRKTAYVTQLNIMQALAMNEVLTERLTVKIL
jgi:polysaccharide export outer membrane protein